MIPTILVGMTMKDLEAFAEKIGEPKYRGRQLAQWIYRKGALTFDAMTDLPKAFCKRLKGVAVINSLQVLDVKVASDGTTKYLSQLSDGETVECVFIPWDDWDTICVSTQVGCPIGCRFCASGKTFARNLTAGEIVGQVLIARRRDSSNIVFMGMGEPMLNFEQLVKAIQLLNKEVGIGARRMTVSTIGIVHGIRKLAKIGLQVNLAVSLYAPSDKLRRRLIPAKLPTIAELLQACQEFFNATKRRISFEYVLLKGTNDQPEHAFELARLLKGLPCHVNLIPYNPTMTNFERPSPQAIERFRRILRQQGISATVRHERGTEIQGACGQLRRQIIKTEGEVR